LKVATWNVNSIKARLEHLIDWLNIEKPDVVFLQELKCSNESFPYEQIEELGYNLAISGQKTYNGVAILSKATISDICTEFPQNPLPQEARFIEVIANFSGKAVRLASVYVPNGQEVDSSKYEMKLEFLARLSEYYNQINKNEELMIVAGDFNVALTEEDVFDAYILKNSICFSLKEKQELRKLIASGFADCYRMHNPNSHEFTWWDYRANSFKRNLGLRIDYIFCSYPALQILKSCSIDRSWREKPKASDHVPVIAQFDI
jgi:exodeoxyribonuclease III